MSIHGRSSPQAQLGLRGCAERLLVLLKMMNFVLKIMNFVSNMMSFVMKMMNFVMKMMDFVLKMMDFVLKMLAVAGTRRLRSLRRSWT